MQCNNANKHNAMAAIRNSAIATTPARVAAVAARPLLTRSTMIEHERKKQKPTTTQANTQQTSKNGETKPQSKRSINKEGISKRRYEAPQHLRHCKSSQTPSCHSQGNRKHRALYRPLPSDVGIRRRSKPTFRTATAASRSFSMRPFWKSASFFPSLPRPVQLNRAAIREPYAAAARSIMTAIATVQQMSQRDSPQRNGQQTETAPRPK